MNEPVRRVRIDLPEAAADLGEFFKDLGALSVTLAPGGAEAEFAGREPAGLEDRVESFLHLVDRPGGRARLWTALGEGPWIEGWRGAFFGADVARFRVRPPWSRPPLDGVSVVVDPRGAFGSGLHPSTQLALALLDQLFDGRQGQSFLDVGAGSGVLAVAAARCGLLPVATELEPAAREACRRTAARNGVQIELHDASPAALGRTFDVVAANIPAGALVQLAAELRAAVGPGGALVLSGARREQMPEVLAAFDAHDQQPLRSPDGEWAAVLLR